MEPLQILEQYGIPICVAISFGFFIWKQNKFIQDELMKELDEDQKELRAQFERLEGIIIGLINAQKKHTIDLRGLNKSYEPMAYIIQKLSGNGLKDKFNGHK